MPNAVAAKGAGRTVVDDIAGFADALPGLRTVATQRRLTAAAGAA